MAAVVCYGAPPPAISCPAKRAAPLQHEEPFKDPEVPYDGPEIPVHEIDDGLHDFEFEGTQALVGTNFAILPFSASV